MSKQTVRIEDPAEKRVVAHLVSGALYFPGSGGVGVYQLHKGEVIHISMKNWSTWLHDLTIVSGKHIYAGEKITITIE